MIHMIVTISWLNTNQKQTVGKYENPRQNAHSLRLCPSDKTVRVNTIYCCNGETKIAVAKKKCRLNDIEYAPSRTSPLHKTRTSPVKEKSSLEYIINCDVDGDMLVYGCCTVNFKCYLIVLPNGHRSTSSVALYLAVCGSLSCLPSSTRDDGNGIIASTCKI